MARLTIKNKPTTAGFKHDALHLASIGREAFAAIADEPMFAHQQGPLGATALTFRDGVASPLRDRRRRPVFGAGLMDRVAAAVKAHGIDTLGREQPAMWSWADQQPSQLCSEFLVRAEGRMRSLAIVPDPAERLRLIAKLAELQEASHILVVAKNNQDSKAVGTKLKAMTKREVTWSPNARAGHPWFHVISVQGLTGCCTLHWGFVIFLDAELALSHTSIDFLTWAPGSIRIGFLARDERRLRQAEFVGLERLFGPVIYRPGDELPRTEISVAWLQPTSKPITATCMLDRKRTQIWKNDSRNRLIARAARSLSDSNVAALNMIGLRGVTSYLTTLEQLPTVAIIVENVEHGEQLARLLLGWRLEGAGYTPPCGRYVLHDRVIMTLNRAAETVLATDVIIYSAAGNDEWLSHAGLVKDAWARKRTLIVDVGDCHDARSAADTHCRAAGYRARGFGEIADAITTKSEKEDRME
ncbi:MAG: hypothetical protein WD738_06840 [Pirellulales bacterium]